MMSFGELALFALAALVMVLSPGPNMIYLISRSLAQGRGAGVVSLFGVATGFLVHMFAAALGLTAVFMAVPLAYDIAVFYLSVFPQFIRPEHGSVLTQSLALGFVQIAVSFAVNLAIILSAAQLAAWFARNPLWFGAQRWIMGCVLGALAVRLALDERRN